MADFPLLSLEDECSWAWYLSCVKTNMLARPIIADDNEPDVQRFYHAKYYGKAYMEIDRVHPVESGVGRHRGTSFGANVI